MKVVLVVLSSNFMIERSSSLPNKIDFVVRVAALFLFSREFVYYRALAPPFPAIAGKGGV